MITSVSLKNFQSHPDTFVEFDGKVNSLLGTSNHGKSSIIRALRLVLDNKPEGVDYISRWVPVKKGKHTEDCVVTITTEQGSVTRIRGTQNAYILEITGQETITFTAFGTKVPQEVIDFLNIGEINLQRQDQNFFLIGDTPLEVMRKINSFVDLELIDEAFSNATAATRQVQADRREVINHIEKLEGKLEKFGIIDEMENIYKDLASELTEYETQLSRWKELKEISKLLEVLQAEYKEKRQALPDSQELESVIQELRLFETNRTRADEIFKLVSTIRTSQFRINESEELPESTVTRLQRVADRVQAKAQEIESLKAALGKIDSLTQEFQSTTLPSEVLWSDIDLLIQHIKRQEESIVGIKHIISDMDRIEQTVDITAGQIADLEKQFHDSFPSQCPLCGAHK